MTDRRQSILREIGLSPLWRLRETQEQSVEVAAVERNVTDQTRQSIPQVNVEAPTSHEKTACLADVPASSVSTMDWDALEDEIRNCRRCVLGQARKQAVPGVGDRQADWMFVGEGPGRDEDAIGEPFVGQAGKLLDNMFAAIGLNRQRDVYIANSVKCRPPHNRTPATEEIAACLPFLERQIALIRPRLLIALGRPAAQSLLEMEVRIGAARGRLFSYKDVPVIVTYHPAYLLRNLPDKAKAWEDLCFARKTMDELRNQ